jgi:SSS family solute:Na+ symporter
LVVIVCLGQSYFHIVFGDFGDKQYFWFGYHIMYDFLSVFAVITLGGMKVIGYTDVIQVFFLILGGFGNYIISSEFGCRKFGSGGVINGFNLMTTQANDHFHMILKKI